MSGQPTNIHQRVGDVLRQHSRVGTYQICKCGVLDGWEKHTDHVAQILVTELGLTEFTCDNERWWATRIELRGERNG